MAQRRHAAAEPDLDALEALLRRLKPLPVLSQAEAAEIAAQLEGWEAGWKYLTSPSNAVQREAWWSNKRGWDFRQFAAVFSRNLKWAWGLLSQCPRAAAEDRGSDVSDKDPSAAKHCPTQGGLRWVDLTSDQKDMMETVWKADQPLFQQEIVKIALGLNRVRTHHRKALGELVEAGHLVKIGPRKGYRPGSLPSGSPLQDG